MEMVEWLLFVDSCGWVVTFGIACVEICWGWGHWESRVGCVGNWDRNLMAREPSGSRMGYLPWLISCRFLRLNPRVQGGHLTSQLSWAAACLSVTHI